MKKKPENKSIWSNIMLIVTRYAVYVGALCGCIVGVVLMLCLGADFWPVITTGVFCAAMGGLFGHDLSSNTYSKSWYPTIGMLGTFIGIVIGLWNLDISAARITESLSELLGGLKLAFITSIVGLGLSILRKLLDAIGWNKIKEIDTVEESLQGIAENTKQLDTNAEIVETLQGLRKDLGKFMTKVTDSATTQFADALGNIASDLNDKLSAQFGENFQQFGTAVAQLVKWQEQNKEYMDNYIAQLQKYTDDYNEKLQALTDAATGVQEIVKQTNAEIVKISGALSQLDEVGNAALDAAPVVRELIASTTEAVGNINSMAHNFADGVKQIASDTAEQMKTVSQNAIEETRQAGLKINNAFTDFEAKMHGGVGKMHEHLKVAGEYIAAAISKVGDNLFEMIRDNENRDKRIDSFYTEIDALKAAAAQAADDTKIATTKKGK